MDTREEIGRGETLFSSGKIEAAKDVFKQIVKEDPDNFEAVNNLGAVCYTLGDKKAAEAHFLRALEAKKDYAEALNNIAVLCQDGNRWHDAALYLERLVSVNPKDADALNRLATAHMKTGDTEKAKKILSESFKVKPDHENTRQALDTVATKADFTETAVGTKSINILFVQDSPCIRNYKMATALRSVGHEVSLAYTVKRLSERYSGLSDDTYNECIHLKSYRDLWDISGNYDLIHCHNEPDILTVAALAGDAPVIHDTHDLISLRANGDATLSYFEGVANRGATGRVYSTPYQKAEAEQLYGVNGPSLVFYNFTSESDLTNNFLPKLSGQDGKIHIVYEGGVGGSAHRDFTGLFVQLASFGIHIHIYPASYNHGQAQFFSQYPCLHYYSPVSPKKIIEEMTQYDYGIIPFNLEKGNKRFLDSTIANKLFEYLAAGLPVIASPLKTYKDYFEQNPIGITFGSPKDIIDNLPKLKAISKETNFSKQIYTFENEIFKLVDFYRQIIGSPNPKVVAPAITKTRSELVHYAFERLLAWIDANGWDGYDPYDIQNYFIQNEKSGTPVSHERQNAIIQKADSDPVSIREKLGIQKKRNSKALGLLISARVHLYKLTDEKTQLEEAEKLADWLLRNPSKGYDNLCWGYPFDWQSVVFIPKETPSSVVSTVVGDGMWELYSVTGKEKYLNACKSICLFITKNLKMDDMGKKGVCFSYTPIDDYHVHNSNLFCGEFLSRAGGEVGNEEWLRLGERTADYAISEQNQDGSIFYWGKIQNSNNPNHLDHYHSGFEIRCLFKLSQYLKSENVKSAYQKYLNFYIENFLLPDGTPKITPRNPYPVNIHGAAESVLMLSTLSKEHKELFRLANKSLVWTINNMQTPDGWFGYLWTPKGRIDAPYLRWGQAWMLRAFGEYFGAKKYRKHMDGENNFATNLCKKNVKPEIKTQGTDLNKVDLGVNSLNKDTLKKPEKFSAMVRRNKRQIFFVRRRPQMRFYKIAWALKKKYPDHELVLVANDIDYSLYENVFDAFYQYKNISELVSIVRSNAPLIYHVKAGPNLEPVIVIENSQVPVIYDAYDFTGLRYGIESLDDEERQNERYALENSHAIVFKFPERILDYYRCQGYSIKCPVLTYMDYCVSDYFATKSPEGNNYHLVYAGVLNPSHYPKEKYGNNQYYHIVKGIISQGINYHIYINKWQLAGNSEYQDYIDLMENSDYFNFHFSRSQSVLQKEISGFHFGCSLHDFSITNHHALFGETSIGNKLSTYLEAGLPLIVSQNLKLNTEVVEKMNVGFGIKLENLRELKYLIENIDYDQLKRNVLKVREKEMSASVNVKGLMDFYKYIGNA